MISFRKEILSLKRIKQLYQNEHKLNFGITTLRNHLRESLSFRFKYVKIKNKRTVNEKNQLIAKIFIYEFIKAKRKGHRFLYVDESGFSNN